MSEALTVVQDGELVMSRPPAEVLVEAQKAAVALQDVISKKSKKVMFNNEQYLEFEDWQTLARFYGITSKVIETRYVEYGEIRGFEARAIALRSDGMEISAAEAACLTDEEKWAGRPRYVVKDGVRKQDGTEAVPLFQIKSMAQTRACAKVLRNVLSWVAVLAGYRPTPAEELDGQTITVTATVSGDGAAHSEPQHTDGLLRVVDVVAKDGKNATTGKPWTKYQVTLSDGRAGSTFDAELGQLAGQCKKDGTVVVAEFEQSGKYTNITGLQVAGQQPSAKPGENQDTNADATKKSISVTRVMDFSTGDTKSFGIETEQLGEGVFLLTADKELAKLAFGAKKKGEFLEATFREKTVKKGTEMVTERWLVDLSIQLGGHHGEVAVEPKEMEG